MQEERKNMQPENEVTQENEEDEDSKVLDELVDSEGEDDGVEDDGVEEDGSEEEFEDEDEEEEDEEEGEDGWEGEEEDEVKVVEGKGDEVEKVEGEKMEEKGKSRWETMKDKMDGGGLGEKEARECVEMRREVYGSCNYEDAMSGKEEREMLRPVLALFRKLKKRGKKSEEDSETDSDSEEDHKEFYEEDAIKLGKGFYAHVYKTPKLMKQMVPKVGILRNGDERFGSVFEQKQKEDVMASVEALNKGKGGAIVFSCEASLEVLSREFPEEGEIRAREIVKELRVEPTPHIYNCFDPEGRLRWPGRNERECMVTMADGTTTLLRNCRSEADGTESQPTGAFTDLANRVCNVKKTPKGSHLEFWMPTGARAASVGMTRGGSKTKPMPLSFVSRVEGDIWCAATGQTESDSSSESDSDESTEGSYCDMFQLGGTAHIEVPGDEWTRDVQCGIVTSRRVPLTGGMALIGRSSFEEDKILSDTTGIVPSHIFLELVVEQFLSWRLAVLRRLGYDKEYVSGDSLVLASPGKSDRVNKKAFHWTPPRPVQTACSWETFEANAGKWLGLVAGTTITQVERNTFHLREMALHIVSKSRIDPTKLGALARAALIDSGVRTRQRCPEVGGLFFKYMAVHAQVPPEVALVPPVKDVVPPVKDVVPPVKDVVPLVKDVVPPVDDVVPPLNEKKMKSVHFVDEGPVVKRKKGEKTQTGAEKKRKRSLENTNKTTKQPRQKRDPAATGGVSLLTVATALAGGSTQENLGLKFTYSREILRTCLEEATSAISRLPSNMFPQP
jgi:hypothetical protein